MVLPRSLVAAGWPGLAYKEGPEDPPEGVSKRITFEHVYTNLALENCTMIWRRLIGCTDESTNQKSPNFKRKITLNSKKFDLVYQFYEYMYMYSNHFFFKIHWNYSHNLLKIISFIFQISIIHTLQPSHPIQFDRNTLQNVYSSLNFILTLFGRTQRLEVLR